MPSDAPTLRRLLVAIRRHRTATWPLAVTADGVGCEADRVLYVAAGLFDAPAPARRPRRPAKRKEPT